MKIKEFVLRYNSEIDETKQELFLKSHVKSRYVSIVEKQVLARAIAQSSYHNEEGELYINSVAKYIYSAIQFMNAYTDLERSDNMLEDFDALNEIGFFKKMQSYIDPDELLEFSEVIEMECDDIMTNECSPGAFVRG